MDKKTYLRAFYISQVVELVEQCNDNSLLYLIYTLLLKSKEEENT